MNLSVVDPDMRVQNYSCFDVVDLFRFVRELTTIRTLGDRQREWSSLLVLCSFNLFRVPMARVYSGDVLSGSFFEDDGLHEERYLMIYLSEIYLYLIISIYYMRGKI